MKIGFLINGKVKRKTEVNEKIATVFADFPHLIHISTHADHFPIICRQALEEGCDHLIFIGGDGTVNEGINALIDYFPAQHNHSNDPYDWHAIATIGLGVFPAGSGNDLVKSLYHKHSLEELRNLIEKKCYQFTDIGLAKFATIEETSNSRFFINIADLGMGGEVVKKQGRLPQWLGPGLSYFWSITSTLISYKNLSVVVKSENYSWKGKVINLVVAKGKYYGSGLGIAPNADFFNGKFALVIIGNVSLWEYFRFLGTVRKCKKVDHPEVRYEILDKITVSSPSALPVLLEMDGELVGKAPVTFECLPKKLKVIAPSAKR